VASFVETHGHAADEGNFEALYTTYKSDVQRLASYLLKNASDAEDAAQTVFLNVLRALRQGVTPSDPRAWLLAITRNVCFSRHRAAAARPNFVELDFETPEEPSGEETPSADEIVGALARLLPNQRTALILRDFRGVSRSEIGHLMALSPAAVEALLTRSRAAFREELDAGQQPYECAETRALVEQQLDGLITVADRHTLRSHLRRCGPCATLARAVRSSRGKVAGLIFWPLDLIARLAGAFSPASSVTHVAAAVTSTAAVAAVAIPVAVSTTPMAVSRSPAAVSTSANPVARAALSAVASATPRSTISRPAPPVVKRSTSKPASQAKLHKQTARHDTAKAKVPARDKTATGNSRATTIPRPAPTNTGATGTIRTSTQSAAAPDPSASPPASASGTPRSSSGIVTPTSGSASPRSSSPRSTGTITRSATTSKPVAKAKPRIKPKAAKKPKHTAGGHHSPKPPDTMPSSTPPAAQAPPDAGAPAGPGAGVTLGADRSPAASSSSSSSSSAGNSPQSSSSAGNDSSGGVGSQGDGNGDGKDKDKKKDKDKNKSKGKGPGA